jgi:hypothetical protein
VFLALFPYQPTTSAPSTDVVSDGAAIKRVFALYRPPFASIGVSVSTPRKAVIPPVESTDDENVHRYDDGSNIVATLT